jgi:hypothetical protein
MKKKRKKLDKGAEARRLARNIGPKPGATKVVVDKRKKPQKYRKSTVEMITASDG